MQHKSVEFDRGGGGRLENAKMSSKEDKEWLQVPWAFDIRLAKLLVKRTVKTSFSAFNKEVT